MHTISYIKEVSVIVPVQEEEADAQERLILNVLQDIKLKVHQDIKLPERENEQDEENVNPIAGHILNCLPHFFISLLEHNDQNSLEIAQEMLAAPLYFQSYLQLEHEPRPRYPPVPVPAAEKN